MGLRTALSATALAVLAVLATPGASAAASEGPGPWQPYEQSEFTAPAGLRCSFALHSEVLRQDLRTRVLQRYPEGAVRRQEYLGPLVVRLVNLRTGEAVRRNLSGHAYVEFRPDGTFKRYTAIGPIGIGFGEASSHPKGFFVLHGYHVITFAPDGVRNMAVDRGPEENICATLGG